MKTRRRAFPAIAAFGLAFTIPASGAILEVVENGLGGDAPAIIGTFFGEDSLTFSDRTHQHNGAAFNSGTGLLSTTGDLVVPLPTYLLDADYVRFANNARENAGYDATITTDVPSTFFLLVDNRVDGAAGNNSSPNTVEPVLEGPLAWVVDDGWERVNSGISPDGQADFTAVDEGGDGVGVGAGQGLNQFYAIYSITGTTVDIRQQGIGGSNNYSVVIAPIPEPSALLLLGLAGLGFLRRHR